MKPRSYIPRFGGWRGGAAALTILFFVAPTLRAGPQIQSLITQLASDDPGLREAALDDLMGLKRQDLPVLRAAAISQCPLLPGQVAQLRQVVFQVFLAGEPFQADPVDPRGFLGVQFLPTDFRWHSDGITISDRIPGFPAYRFLRPGDIVVKLIDWPKVQLHTAQDLIDAVKYLDAGQVVPLGIMRSGRAMTVALPLDFRPLLVSAPGTRISDVDNWVQMRQKEARAYWSQNFSIIDPAASAGQASTSFEP